MYLCSVFPGVFLLVIMDISEGISETDCGDELKDFGDKLLAVVGYMMKLMTLSLGSSTFFLF